MDSEFLDISTNLRLQLGYGVGHILNDVCASLWFTYLLVFLHLVLEFSASQAGTLLLIGQVVDAVSTPFVGYHSDHTNSALSAKYGKRKLWHLFGTACVVVSFPFVFTECVGCSHTHKWAQMFYFASFIMLFQIGWAAVQISHLSLIPELSDDEHTRTHLTAFRYGFTVLSNLLVYIVTWLVLHFTGNCNTEQVGPGDAWKFQKIVYIVMTVGVLASIFFHIIVKEKNRLRLDEEPIISQDSNTHINFLRRPSMYQVAGIYMSTRLVVNVSQVLIPLYLHKTLGLPARSLAVIPLAIYLGSLVAAAAQRLAPRLPRKLLYLVGSSCAMAAFVAIYLFSGYNYNHYYIYVVAVLIGFGGAVMLVTSLALTADLVGSETEASAFVYGLMSFTDKLSCGIVIAVIQHFADESGVLYYRYTLSLVCGSATVLGLLLTMLLPRMNYNDATLLVEENTSSSRRDSYSNRQGPDL